MHECETGAPLPKGAEISSVTWVMRGWCTVKVGGVVIYDPPFHFVECIRARRDRGKRAVVLAVLYDSKRLTIKFVGEQREPVTVPVAECIVADKFPGR